MKRNAKTTKTIVTLAMLAAISVVLVALIHFPLFVPYLEYDPADIPILIGTFVFGPVWGLVLTVVAGGIQALTVSSGSGWVGFLMHVIATGSMAVAAGSFYKKFHTKKGAAIALIIGTVTMTVVMIPLNLIMTPLFSQGTTAADVAKMIVPVLIPFNFVKAGINSLITFFVYKRVSILINGKGEND